MLGGMVLVGGLIFGFAGGEYSTVDGWSLGRSLEAEKAAIARLEVEIDSLRREAEALETDPATQERVARERFGMLRDGELMYRVRSAPRREDDSTERR